MSRYHKVEDHPDLVRDTKSRAVLNTNVDALRVHKKRRMISENQEKINDSIDTMQNEINTLKDDVSDIKSMLSELIRKI